MAAFGTKKPNGDRGVQLTFPSEFTKAYTGGYSFFPSDMGHSLDLMVGSDFQATYHEEKRLDANKLVANRLQSRRTMEQKLLTGHQNYHLPKPVLGQRKFANPMNGVVGFQSARRDQDGAPFAVVEGGMRGGVVVTPEGQEFYAMALKRRIDQLNRINALAQGFAVPMGQRFTSFSNQREGAPDKVDFFTLLRGLTDTVVEGDFTRFSFDSLKELVKMLIRFAPTATDEDFNDIMDGLDIIDRAYRKYEASPEQIPGSGFEEYGESVRIYVGKAREYAVEMFKNSSLAPRDRKALSDSLVRSLGFNRLVVKKTEADAIKDVARTSNRVRDSYENFDGRYGGDGDDDGGGDGQFNRNAVTREDEEARGAPSAPLAGNNGDPNRERFGRRRGILVEPAFFGEEGEGEEEFVAPLGLSGFDPDAQIPAQDSGALQTAVSNELETILREMGYTEGNMDAFVAETFEDEAELTDEIERRMLAKTFTKPQIAKGMEMMRKPYFASYIASNAGEIEPAPIQRSVPARPLDPFPASVPRGGIPPRAELLRKTTEELAAFGRSLPDFGIPRYNPRAGAKRRSILATLIKRLKAADPSY